MQYAIFVVNHRIPSSSPFQTWRRSPFRCRSARWAGPAYGLEAPRAPLGVPIWKPFLKRREMVDRDRMRPVPVVFLRLAFSDQLSVCPACQRPVLVRVPVRRPPIDVVVDRLMAGSVSSDWGGLVRSRTLPGLSSGVSARSAGVLLDVHGAAACLSTKSFPVSPRVLAMWPSSVCPKALQKYPKSVLPPGGVY